VDGIPVWDAIVRLSHWALATTCVFNFIRDDGDRLHRIVGYVAAGIVVVRLFWACITHGHGGIAALRLSVSSTLIYARQVTRGRAPRHLGHDPLGLWMVWLVWLLVLMLALSGWMTRLDMFWGDEGVKTVHAWLADALAICILFHVAGVAMMSWQWRENLAKSMVTGTKRGPDESA
jgi:cytochrome b